MGLASSSAARRLISTETVSPIAGRLDAARRAVEGRFLEAGEVLAAAVDGVGGPIASLDRLGRPGAPATVEPTPAERKAAAASLNDLPGRQADQRAMVERLSRLDDD